MRRTPPDSSGDIAFLNARLIDPASGRDEPGGALVKDRLIADLGPQLRRNAPEGARVIDCKGHVLCPGLIDMQVFTAGSLLAELRANYAVTMPRQLTLHWHSAENLPPLHTDRRKLRQILDNLIGNAVKFTDRGTVTVAARVGEGGAEAGQEATYLEFSVSDTGVGIPEETLGKIFDKFYQVDSSETRSYGGVGMGLYIAKRFTDLLGGEITVESVLGKGSTFSLRIPRRPTAA